MHKNSYADLNKYQVIMTIIDNNDNDLKSRGGGEQPRSKLSANAAAELEDLKKELAAMLAADQPTDATPPPEPEEGANSDVCSAEDDNFPAAENPPSDILQIQNGQEQDIEEGVSNILKITVTKKIFHVSQGLSQQSPDDNLGFTYVQEPITGRYFISSVAADGLCGQTDLKKGQEVLEINGTSLQGMEREGVRDLFAPSFGRVTDVTITVTHQDINAADAVAVPTNTSTTTTTAGRSRLVSYLYVCYMAVFFGVAMVIFLTYPWESRTKADGIVLSCQKSITHTGFSRCDADIGVVEEDGDEFSTQLIGQLYFDCSSCDETCCGELGGSWTVWYNPSNPEESITTFSRTAFFVATCILAGVGLALLVCCVVSRIRVKRHFRAE
jgi:hypothetical protein